jgi:Dihaem cytochrome c
MRGFRSADFARSFTTLSAIVLLLMLSGCARNALPDQASPGAELYIARCGGCHAPYNPHTMTADMWRAQVPMMEDKMRQAGLPSLSDSERSQILDYLSANAGQQ